jgi:hypothetical protein
MKRSDAIRYHRGEAAALRRTAAEDPDTSGASQCRAAARDHEDMAEAAELHDYHYAELED